MRSANIERLQRGEKEEFDETNDSDSALHDRDDDRHDGNSSLQPGSGARRRLPYTLMLRIALIASLLAATIANASSVDVTVRCRSENCNLRTATLVLRSTTDATVHRVMLQAATAQITEQAGSQWDVTVDAKDLWSLQQQVTFPTKGDVAKQSIMVWRTGILRGRLTVPDPQPQNPLAARIMVATRPEPRIDPDIPRGTSFPCSIELDGAWQCAVPATLLDVALLVEGYVPYHRWDMKIPAGGAVEVGTVKLQKGGSLVAWLDSGFAKRVGVPVHAAVRYEAMPAPSAVNARLALPIAEGVFTQKGVAQLAPIAPGRYILEVAAKGYAPTRIPVQVYEGRETTPRQSIELSPALTVRLHLEPPTGPRTTPWRIELWRMTTSGTGSQNAGSGTVARDGTFEAGGQPEGPLRVHVKDAEQNIVANREIVVTPNISDYSISIAVTRITGKVSLGADPLAKASLLFGGSGGPEKIRTTSDVDGHFSVTLSHDGKWIVDIAAPAEAVATTTEVTVEKESVDIDLPATAIAGWVRDANGTRLPAAQVLLFTNGRPMTRVTEADGTFRFRGVQSGAARLRASDPRTHDSSRFIDITVPESDPVDNVELNLESVKLLGGLVRSGGEPVVGALVHGYAAMGSTAQREQATTDLQGQFSFNVPGSALEAIIVVAAPGRTLEGFSAPTSDDQVILDLAPRGGTVMLHWTPSEAPLRMAFNDHPVPAVEFFAWARGQGARIENGQGEIPNVAPGKYQLCSATHCAEGLLAIGSRLDLDTTH